MKDMSRALNFGKAVADNAWGMFLRFLKYKLISDNKEYCLRGGVHTFLTKYLDVREDNFMRS